MQRPASRGALLTISNLFGGLVLGLLAGDLAFRLIPGSNVNHVQLRHAAIAAMPALIGFLAGGVLWGVQMGRMVGSANLRRMAWAGALGFAPLTIALAVGLGLAEPMLVSRFTPETVKTAPGPERSASASYGDN